MQINIAICDDNEAYTKTFKSQILKCMDNTNSYNITSYTSGNDLIKNITKKTYPDIIFLDIFLDEKILGTTVGITIKNMNPNILLIYISAFDIYYKDIIQAEPFSFIMKPIDEHELQHIMNDAIKRIYFLKKEFVYTYKSNGIIHRIDLKDVMYFESQHRIINIYDCNGNIISFYEKLDDVEKEVEEIYPYFMRPNKSYYVNYNYVERFSHTYIEIDGKKLHITSGYRKRYDDKKFLLL